jgi:hypothetical protein
MAASLAVAVPALALPAGAVGGSDSGFFSARAYSSPIGVEFFDAGAPVIPGEVVYASVAVTKAAVDSVGNSAGFAGGPYMGDNVPALMGAFNAIGPFGAILPPYPFMVLSQYPGAPKAAQDSGPRHLAANSDENGSDGDAHVGLARGNPGLLSVSSTSKAVHDPATGASTATADGSVVGFSVGPTLTIGQIASHADVSAKPGEPLAKHTSLSIGSLTVMGTLVGLTDKGLVPVPGTPKTADLNSLTKQLSAAGISLGLLPGEDSATGTDSAALVVGIIRDVPGGQMRVRIILGRVQARVDTGPAQPA